MELGTNLKNVGENRLGTMLCTKTGWWYVLPYFGYNFTRGKFIHLITVDSCIQNQLINLSIYLEFFNIYIP
jgi:hypothetical protein